MKKLTILLMLLPATAMAQDDFGVWYSAGAEKKIDKRWSVGVEAELRTRNDSRTIDRWDLGADVEYKIAKHLKASAGYTFLRDNNKEKISLHSDGTYNNWRPSYWGSRHRFHVDLTGSLDVGRLSLSLRERWQYTYRPSSTTRRYDFDNSLWEDTEVSGRGKNVLRSRLQVDYNIPKCKVDPYASVELFNAWSVKKVRYTVGAEWKIKKSHTLGLFYRFQDVRGDDGDNQADTHIVGLGYKFKF